VAYDTELVTSQYLTTPSAPEGSDPPAEDRAVRSTVSQANRGVNCVLGFVLAASLGTVVGAWACNGAAESKKAADWLLWVAGSDKTWEEYQKGHVSKGNARLKDDDATWMQQLFQDAYAGNNR
jgi:hypothetical protein